LLPSAAGKGWAVTDAEDKPDPSDVDDEFLSLLEGLRVTLPGVQLITAFLLTVPLYDRFPDLQRTERVAYYIAFGCGLASSVLLTAPSSHQRLRARGGSVARHSARHLEVAVRLTIAGSALFGVALAAVAYVVSSLVLSTPAAVSFTATMALVLGWSWFYLPLVTFRKK
jgi:hypothetical protein